MLLYAPLGWPLRNECKNALCIDYQRRVSQNISAEFIEWLRRRSKERTERTRLACLSAEGANSVAFMLKLGNGEPFFALTRSSTQDACAPLLHSTTTRSVAPRPKVSGWYISSAFGGGTTKEPGVVARAT